MLLETMKVFTCAVFGTLFVSATLKGCGGGGGALPTPTPTVSPTIAPTPAPVETMEVSVLSFNLKWYAQHGMKGIDKSITSMGQFDFMGLQECENVGEVVAGLNGSWGWVQLWDGPHDIAVAWNAHKYTNVSQGFAECGKDSWWTRQIQWVRLQIKGTDDHIFFANVHGAVASCNGTRGYDVFSKYREVIHQNMKEGDHLFFTGDFNCQSYDNVIKKLGEVYSDSAQASWFFPVLYQPDHIFTSKTTQTKNWTGVCCRGAGNCYSDQDPQVKAWWPGGNCIADPSDHAALKGDYLLPISRRATKTMVV